MNIISIAIYTLMMHFHVSISEFYPAQSWEVSDSSKDFGACTDYCTGLYTMNYEAVNPFVCVNAERTGIVHPWTKGTCKCSDCRHECTLEDIDMDTSVCDYSGIQLLSDNAMDHVDEALISIATGAASLAGFDGIAIAVDFVGELVNADGENDLYNSLASEFNQRMGDMSKCMGMEIQALDTQIHIDHIQSAMNAFDIVSEFKPEGASETFISKLFTAWFAYEGVSVYFDDLDAMSADFESLLMPMRTYLKTFYLVSVDYLTQLKILNDPNYDNILQDTLESFDVFRAWASKGRDVVIADKLAKIRLKACDNANSNIYSIESQIRSAVYKLFGTNDGRYGISEQINNYQSQLRKLENDLDGVTPSPTMWTPPTGCTWRSNTPCFYPPRSRMSSGRECSWCCRGSVVKNAAAGTGVCR